MSELARALTEDEAILVQNIIRCMLDERPDMYEKYSEAAPRRTQEDVAFHLRHLSGALIADDSLIFVNYYEWLQGVLLPRGVTQEDIDLNFRCLITVLEATYGDAAAQALAYIDEAVHSPGRAS